MTRLIQGGVALALLIGGVAIACGRGGDAKVRAATRGEGGRAAVADAQPPPRTRSALFGLAD